MENNWKETRDYEGNLTGYKRLESDGSSTWLNKDHEIIKKWLAEGNTPEPADE